MQSPALRPRVGLLSFLLLTISACADFDRFSVVKLDAGSDAATDAGDGGNDDPDARVVDGGECSKDQDCGDLEFCSASNACEPRKPNAQDCASSSQCLSGFCDPDGICCTAGEDCCDDDSECAGQYRCDVGARECFGSCSVGTETSACKPGGHCSVAGNCVADLAAGAANACTRDTMCSGNANCLDGFCCDGACGGCQACNVAGSLGVCAPAVAGTDPHDVCAASGCTNDGTCNGSGACRVVPAGTDPNDACAGGFSSCIEGFCDGWGGCAPKPNGTECGFDQCGEWSCSSGVCQDSCGAQSCQYCSPLMEYQCGGC